MPSEKSARSSVRKQVRNRSIRSATRTYVAKAVKSIASEDGEDMEASVKQALRTLDKAAKAGVVHPNNAARRKSRLMKRLNSPSSKG